MSLVAMKVSPRRLSARGERCRGTRGCSILRRPRCCEKSDALVASGCLADCPDDADTEEAVRTRNAACGEYTMEEMQAFIAAEAAASGGTSGP